MSSEKTRIRDLPNFAEVYKQITGKKWLDHKQKAPKQPQKGGKKK